MDRDVRAARAMLMWVASSAFLLFICGLSTSATIVVAAYVVIGGSLLMGLVLFALKRDKWASRAAASPAFAVAGILLVALVANFFLILWNFNE
jgi:hypothetical protein